MATEKECDDAWIRFSRADSKLKAERESERRKGRPTDTLFFRNWARDVEKLRQVYAKLEASLGRRPHNPMDQASNDRRSMGETIRRFIGKSRPLEG